MSQEKTYSFAQFPALQIGMACRAWENDREHRIAATKEKRIAEAMKPRKRWFGLVTSQMTREQAIASLSTSDNDWFLPEFKRIEMLVGMSYWAAKVADLRILAKHSKDTVALDAELFKVIAPFYMGGEA